MHRSRYFQAYGLWHMGEGFQTILLMWYMTFHARLSASEIGFYQALQLVPFLMFTVIGGNLTDRIGPRLSYALSTGLFAVTLGFYGLLDPLIGFHPWIFAAYCLLSGVLSAISNPAIDTFIPEATPRPATDNALMAATAHNIAKLSGNAATLALPFLSAIGGFIVNGLLMAASVVFLWRHQGPARPAPEARRPPALRRVVGHFRAYPASFDILLASTMLGLFVVPAGYIFQPLVLRLYFPDQAHLIGLNGVVGWCGAILATGLAARFAGRLHHPGRIALMVWTIGALLTLTLFTLPNYGMLLFVLFLLGANSVGKALIYGHYLRDAPPTDRGMLIGVDQTAFWGLATLGTMVLGAAVDHFGFTATVTGNAAAILICTLLLALRGRLWGLANGGR